MTLSAEEEQRLKELLTQKAEKKKFNKNWYWWEETAYPWQWKLANSSRSAAQIMGMMANQIGKSMSGAAITSCHLTGLYPEGWEGHRFEKPIRAWVCGVSTETTRDILQALLLGEPGDPSQEGTAAIPKHCIIDKVRKPQTPNGVQKAIIQHFNSEGKPDGYSTVEFKAYEQGEEKFMGRPMDWIWLDEQPPSNIYTQCITRTVATHGFVMMTFTPESGMTPTIHQFLTDLQPGQALVQATWNDAPHLSEERKAQLLAQYPPHEREIRTRGIPVFGRGQVWPIIPSKIECQRFEIPAHWDRIAGMDFGGAGEQSHCTAYVAIAIDPDTNKKYVYDTYKENHGIISTHASALKHKPGNIPIAWPHDGMKCDPGSGTSIADLYRQEGVNLLPERFCNPPALGQKTGDIRIEPGVMAILQAMEEGSFKVFSDLSDWWDEFGMYHRNEHGKVVDKNDDLMAATRYAFQSARFASEPQDNDTFYSVSKQQNWNYIV